VFFFVEYVTEDGQKMSKHVGGLLYILYIILSNYSVVAGVIMCGDVANNFVGF
jgi:hypothetical protein